VGVNPVSSGALLHLFFEGSRVPPLPLSGLITGLWEGQTRPIIEAPTATIIVIIKASKGALKLVEEFGGPL
jgi:hypothetical protein